jgi:hypothetical protein
MDILEKKSQDTLSQNMDFAQNVEHCLNKEK